MKRNTTAFLLTPLALLAASAPFAQDVERPNYNFVELDYIYSTIDAKSPELGDNPNSSSWYQPDGLALKGSFVLFDELLLRASYAYSEGTWKSTRDTENTTGTVSVGWLAPTTDATGIDISLEYRADDLKFKNNNEPDGEIAGPGIVFGVRTAPWKSVELGLRAGWYEGDYNGAIGFGVSGAWNIGDHWGINVFWDRIDADPDASDYSSYENNQYGVGGRFYF
jgi:hypothetical protein